ncbi:MAG TPA: lipopolysaccharide heptosyltransferase II, partial [Candidatus Polarisedimenticolia bacterium]|nr:lipopolysaccharide heptosyltransferase II [Candidatus Polarisedimenticolia bacterium]
RRTGPAPGPRGACHLVGDHGAGRTTPLKIIQPDSIHRILVRANNWIGDVVMISPSLRLLRETYPAAVIDVLARPQVADCFTDHPWVDGLVRHEPAGRHRGVGGFLRLAAELRERRYDMAVLFQKAFGAALTAFAARVPIRVGFGTDMRSALLTHAIHETPELRRIHHVDYFLMVAREAGCRIDGVLRRVYFPLDDDSRAFATEFLERYDAGRFAFLAVFATGASKPPRAWHPERFAHLAGSLAREKSAGILVVGGPSDRTDADRVLEAAGAAGIDAVGRTTVRQMAALIERCRVFVGNDSGPMHVAAALDVPVLALFGPGTPARTAPYMAPERYVALTADYPCSPCRQDFVRECEPASSLKPMCLESIDVRQASAALNALLVRSAA